MRYVLIILISMEAAIAQAEHAPNVTIGVGYEYLQVVTRPSAEDEQVLHPFQLPLSSSTNLEICPFPCELGPGYHDIVSQTMVLGGPKDFSIVNNLGMPTETTDYYWVYHDFPGSHGGIKSYSSWQQDEVSLAWRLGTSTIEFNVGAPQQEDVVLFDLFAFEGVSLIGTSRVLSNSYAHPVRLDFHENAYSLTWHENEPPEHTEFYAIPLPAFQRSDMNFNQQVDFDDIRPFVLALSNPTEYLETWGRGILTGAAAGDADQDGDLDFDDIPMFVRDLINFGEFTGAIPEPSTFVLSITILFFAAAFRVVHTPLATGRRWFK